MAKYITQQRKRLLHFLAAHPDEALTARQIADALQGDGISASAVYRNLAALESEDKLQRISHTGSREISYRYTAATGCQGCLHLSCKKCGRTFHLQDACANQIVQSVARHQQFAIDRADTVLYGLCSTCQCE